MWSRLRSRVHSGMGPIADVVRLVALFLLVVAPPLAADKPKKSSVPNAGHIVSLMGRFSVAHGCPVGPRRIITNAHVVDPEPFDRDAPALPQRYENAETQGVFTPDWISASTDLAAGTTSNEIPYYYTVASHGPQVGEDVWWIGYSWQNRRRIFERILFTGEVSRVVAGSIVIDAETPQGSSGSCILNAAGEVYGVMAWSMKTADETESAAIGVGVWGEWAPPPPTAPDPSATTPQPTPQP